MVSSPPRRRILSRVRHACQRCKAQKLRCDNIRPCSTCSRLNLDCKESSAKATAIIAAAQPISASSPLIPTKPGSSTQHERDSASGASSQHNPEESRAESSTIYSQRPSTYEAVDQVFRQRQESSGLLHAANAIPGGSQGLTPGRNYLRWTDILDDLAMPPAHIVNFLLDVYATSVHWFMSVFHEPTIRASAHSLLATGMVEEHRKLFPILLLIILAMAARYVSPEAAEQVCPGYDLAALERSWIKCIEWKLLDVFEEGGLEAVQIIIILKSYYLYGNRPKRSIAILGAGIKVALSMKLHLESTWTTSDPIEVNVRRRLWWSLYVADVWAATIYGTPCSIHDDDCEVALPGNIDDAIATCPGYDSTDVVDGETFGRVNVFSYQRFKFTLYKLAFSIINTVYTHRKTTSDDIIQRIRMLDERMKKWEAQIPPELLLKNIAGSSHRTDDTTSLFQRQALVLQISIDNFKLLLHRPLLTINRLPTRSRPGETNGLTASDEMIKRSKYTCWEAAVRTSQIGGYKQTMATLRYSLGASYTMIQSFTAAVALGIFALSDPTSRQANEAKGAISRILAYPNLFGYQTMIFDQTTAILEELLRLILNEEMKALVGKSSSRTLPSATPSIRQPPDDVARRQSLIMPVSNLNAAENQQTPQNIMGPSPDTSGADMTYGNFSDALISLQDAFRENRGTDGAIYNSFGQDFNNSADPRFDGWVGQMNNPFSNDSQAWIWDDLWQASDNHFDLG